MEEHIIISTLGTSRNGQDIRLFRIPNSTNDYIEVTNYGCTIKSIFIHNRQGQLQNVLCGYETLEEYAANTLAFGLLLGSTAFPELGTWFSHQVWDVQEVGENHVLLSCLAPAGTCGLDTSVKAGIRIMWVNLNRLVIDLFLTPEKPLLTDLSTSLFLRLAEDCSGYMVRSFCPAILIDCAEIPVSDSPYRDMAFIELDSSTPAFRHTQEKIKPMAELVNEASGFTISAYGTTKNLIFRQLPQAQCVKVCQSSGTLVPLNSGETLNERVIYGFDHIHPQEEESAVFSPFAAFL